MRRFFTISVVLGLLLLLASIAIRNVNRSVWIARHDTATVSYFMRSNIHTMFVMVGVALTIGGVSGLRMTRNVKGGIAQYKAATGAMPVYIFAFIYFAKAAIAIPFLIDIYSTSNNSRSSIPFDLDEYYKLQWVAMGVGGAMLLSLVFYMHAKIKRVESSFKPACQNCGYSLRGLKNHTCPECGTAFH